jgi:hypothetical protein
MGVIVHEEDEGVHEEVYVRKVHFRKKGGSADPPPG